MNDENRTIRIRVKNVYGSELTYPVDHADTIRTLTGRKTLTPSDIEALTALGFTFARVF